MKSLAAVLFTIAAGLAGATPVTAQPLPDAVRTVLRERARIVRDATTVYQGRDRDQYRSEQTERTTRRLNVGARGVIDLSNIAGDISIVRGGGNEATLEVIKVAKGRTPEDAKELLQLVQVEITERSGRAEVRTRYPQGEEMRRQNRRNINVSVDYNVTAPEGTRVIARSISGNVSARDIKGDVTLESISGAVRIHNGGRVAAAKSVSGNVEVVETEIEGTLEASSVSGSVVLRNVTARRLDVGSVSGNVIVEDVECDRVDAQSVSGDVRFRGPLARSGRYDLQSHSGEVRVAIGDAPGFELDASSFSGSVRSDFNITMQGAETSRGRQKSLRGVYGDGSAVLDLSTFSGSILITRR